MATQSVGDGPHAGGCPEDRIPQIVVGIDFGMTCTAVAFSEAPNWEPPKPMQHWPPLGQNELVNKVRTAVLYEEDGITVKQWGFTCENTPHIKEFFKLRLGTHNPSQFGDHITQQEARRAFQDYITCIYKHVVTRLQMFTPDFEKMGVEFTFSVPTTWKDVRMIEEIRILLDNAVSSLGMDHWVVIGLTEAEAAAVYAARRHYKKGDVMLVCDAGGGTTDVNILKLVSQPGMPVKLEQLGSVEGRPIGSVFIDQRIHKIIEENLDRVQNELEVPSQNVAWEMIGGHFQREKSSFSDPDSFPSEVPLNIPHLKNRMLNAPLSEIKDGKFILRRVDLQDAFDRKIREMCKLLDDQIQDMADKHPTVNISYLVLSGGFGSSSYVRKCLQTRYGYQGPGKSPNTLGLRILEAEEPQLAVVHGLVLDRIQQLKDKVTVFQSRICQVSYGVVCDVLFNPNTHEGQEIRRDERDGNVYATEQIEWLIKQNKPVRPEGITKEFQLKVRPGEEYKLVKVRIVTSNALLPGKTLRSPGVHEVCTLKINPTGVERKLKNKQFYRTRPAYWRVVFDVKVLVGPADLSFQLWSKDRRVSSSSHKPIQVHWRPAGPVDRTVDDERDSDS